MVFGDPVVPAAMIDLLVHDAEVVHLVHHAKVVSLKAESYRLKDRDLRRVPTDNYKVTKTRPRGSVVNRWKGVNLERS